MRNGEPAYSCAEVQERLEDFLDQELSSSEAQRMREHIGSCVSCAGISQWRYNQLAQLRDSIQRLAVPSDPAFLLLLSLVAETTEAESE